MYRVFAIFRNTAQDCYVKYERKQNNFDVGAAICRPPRSEYNLCGQNGTTSRHVIPSGVKRSRGIFPSSKFYPAVVLFPTWWIPPLRYGRNDRRFWFACNKSKCTTIPAYAGWRQIAAATPGTSNGIRNVAAMIHRHPAPPRGWPRWMLRIRKSNEWPYGQWRQIAAATPGTSNRIRNAAAMIHRHPAPPRGWLRWLLRMQMSNGWSYGQWWCSAQQIKIYMISAADSRRNFRFSGERFDIYRRSLYV